MVARRQEVLLNVAKINLLSIVVTAVVLVLSALLYAFIHLSRSGGAWVFDLGVHSIRAAVLFFGLYFVLIAVHELIHGASYLLLGKAKTKYDIQWKKMVIAARAQSPMPLNVFRWSVLMPTLVIALPLYVAGLAAGNFAAFLMGAIHLVSGLGDYAILWSLRGFPATFTAMDHPNKPGCVVYSGDK